MDQELGSNEKRSLVRNGDKAWVEPLRFSVYIQEESAHKRLLAYQLGLVQNSETHTILYTHMDYAI